MSEDIQYDPEALCVCLHTAYWHRNKGRGGCDDCGTCVGFEHATKAFVTRPTLEFRTYSGDINLPVGVEGSWITSILVREVIDDDGTRAAHISFRRFSSDTWGRPQRIEEA